MINLFCVILFCLSISALVIACLAFTKKDYDSKKPQDYKTALPVSTGNYYNIKSTDYADKSKPKSYQIKECLGNGWSENWSEDFCNSPGKGQLKLTQGSNGGYNISSASDPDQCLGDGSTYNWSKDFCTYRIQIKQPNPNVAKYNIKDSITGRDLIPPFGEELDDNGAPIPNPTWADWDKLDPNFPSYQQYSYALITPWTTRPNGNSCNEHDQCASGFCGQQVEGDTLHCCDEGGCKGTGWSSDWCGELEDGVDCKHNCQCKTGFCAAHTVGNSIKYKCGKIKDGQSCDEATSDSNCASGACSNCNTGDPKYCCPHGKTFHGAPFHLGERFCWYDSKGGDTCGGY